MTSLPSNTTFNATDDSGCIAILKDVAGPPPIYSVTQTSIIASVLLVCITVTIIGNAIVILAIVTHARLQRLTDAFVFSLAVADIMVGLLVMPFGVYRQFNNNVWNFGRFICLLTTCLDVMFSTASILTLSCLTMDRYLAVCKPFIHQRLTMPVASVLLFLCWFLPLLISFIPIFNGWNHVGIEDFINCAFPPSDPTHCAFIVNRPYSVICSLIAFYIPLVFIVVCNMCIYHTARQQAYQIHTLEMSAQQKKQKDKLRVETKAAKTIGVILGCFLICWCPFFVMNIIDPYIGYKIPYTTWTVALWLGYVNSMLNPFLYYKFNRQYNHAFRRIFTCKLCRGIRDVDTVLLHELSTQRAANSAAPVTIA